LERLEQPDKPITRLQLKLSLIVRASVRRITPPPPA
jgi:hypothetical protein